MKSVRARVRILINLGIENIFTNDTIPNLLNQILTLGDMCKAEKKNKGSCLGFHQYLKLSLYLLPGGFYILHPFSSP